ncbi:MAG: caspase family protein, partial [Elusimicrobia bacterium]|nr:caspase family protein [Elusimicrobiota bacterium]
FDADPLGVEFQTRAVKPPRLEVARVKLSRASVRAGEATPVSVTVANAGGGAAQAVTAALELGSPDIFMSGEPSAELGALKPGESKTAEFEFFVKKRYRGAGPLPVSVSLRESTGRYGLAARSLQLSLGQGAPEAAVVGVPSQDELEDVDTPPVTRTKADPEAYAVVVGVEKYRDIPAVEFAARDAQAVYDYLTRSMGFDPKNVAHLADERATRTDLATYLGPWLKDRVTAKSRVLIYFSGHGSPDPVTGEGYLVPYDGSPNYLGTTALPLKGLYDELSRLPARDVTVVLDSCFSGAGGRSLLAQGVRPLVNVKPAAPGGNMVVLSAARSEQISTYYPEAQHGVFTYFLLKGLRGAADADRGGAVTTAELYAYLRPEVERAARRRHVEQTPAIAPELPALGARAGRVWLKLK